ncbi:Hypothetical protein SRAE_X000051000 [Strongyloides ratti]|uniref:Uncharacterized protein n=1 Tax=Strongyloides ratti TaxID=34506 RepID=A0A090N0S2_STRRB|nr:Hypothetical protein SRAE_X000051000 [Strongyloides ratti]CEF71183.2 Hypothetical protein SRAE_X000051000 [Strongyloides ratti]
MNLLTINFFALFFGINIVTINGCQVKCNRIFRRGRCTLFINLDVDPFFQMTTFCLQPSSYQNLQRMNRQRTGMNAKQNAQLLQSMSQFATVNINPQQKMSLCSQCRSKCGMQTQIKIIGSVIQGRGSFRRNSMLTVSQRRKNVFANAIHEDANDPLYASVKRRSQRGRFNGNGFQQGRGSFRGPGIFQRPGSMHHSNSVRARQRAVFANERLDSDE